MEIKKYPDGSSYATCTNDLFTPNHFRVNTYEDLWHLNQLVDAFVHGNDGREPTITIPCLIDAQADRRFGIGESHGLKLVCEFLNRMPAKFKIFHPHNPEVVEALIDNVEIIDNKQFINSVLVETEEIIESEKSNNLILMSSDAGGSNL